MLNNMFFANLDVTKLAQKYGTPLYIMDEDIIIENIRLYKAAMKENFGENFDIAYASKAFCTSYMYKILKDEGISADIVSQGEMYTAINAGFSAEKLYFHGNNKSIDELKYAIENNIYRIVVDNTLELENINDIAADMGKKVKIMFRIKPGVDAHTHEFIKTGQIDCKFGQSIENNEAFNIIKKAMTLKNIEIMGLHCHIGSQIFESSSFAYAAEIMIDFIDEINKKLNFDIKELNLGGGFGIKYTNIDNPKTAMENITAIAKAIKNKTDKIPKIIIEPGRSIVGNSGITAYTVGNIKEIENVRNYVSIDGGITDNPRFALYKSEYDFIIANNINAKKDYKCAIAGKCCESGDMLSLETYIAKPKTGDILCTINTGAYNYSMASHYNKIPKPAVVMISNKIDKLIVRRETYQDLIRQDIF